MGTMSGSGGAPSKLFVGGISAHTTTEALRGHFSRYGRIVDAVVMQKNGRPRGFGFVTFDAAGRAVMALSEPHWIDGRQVDVKQAVPGERSQLLPPHKERGSNKIFVGGLPQDIAADDLKAHFGNYGPVADAVVMVDRRTSRSRGFGFVRFASGVPGSAASEAVLMDFSSHRLGGKWVEVKRATPAALLAQEGLSPSGSTDVGSTLSSADISPAHSCTCSASGFVGCKCSFGQMQAASLLERREQAAAAAAMLAQCNSSMGWDMPLSRLGGEESSSMPSPRCAYSSAPTHGVTTLGSAALGATMGQSMGNAGGQGLTSPNSSVARTQHTHARGRRGRRRRQKAAGVAARWVNGDFGDFYQPVCSDDQEGDEGPVEEE
jgi:RNA recognition motif-containing protein